MEILDFDVIGEYLLVIEQDVDYKPDIDFFNIAVFNDEFLANWLNIPNIDCRINSDNDLYIHAIEFMYLEDIIPQKAIDKIEAANRLAPNEKPLFVDDDGKKIKDTYTALEYFSESVTDYGYKKVLKYINDELRWDIHHVSEYNDFHEFLVYGDTEEKYHRALNQLETIEKILNGEIYCVSVYEKPEDFDDDWRLGNVKHYIEDKSPEDCACGIVGDFNLIEAAFSYFGIK